jgi:hypothetical protein
MFEEFETSQLIVIFVALFHHQSVNVLLDCVHWFLLAALNLLNPYCTGDFSRQEPVSRPGSFSRNDQYLLT